MECGRLGESGEEELEGSDGEEFIVIDDSEDGKRKVDEADVDSGSKKMGEVRECVEREGKSLGDEDIVTLCDVKDAAEKNQKNSQTCRPVQTVKLRVLYSLPIVEQDVFLNGPLRYPVIVTGAYGEMVCLYSEDVSSLRDSKGYKTDSIMDAFC